MVDRLPSWVFLSLALVLIGLALFPLMRVVIGIDERIGIQFFSVIMLLIGGLMSGLTAMILMVRRQPILKWSANENTLEPQKSAMLHGTGFLIFTGIPLLNFLVCYYLWVSRRHGGEAFDRIGQEVLNYQISMYLYLLLSLFMVFAGIGLITTPLLLAIHLLFSLSAIVCVLLGKQFKYPINIPIIQGRETKVPAG